MGKHFQTIEKHFAKLPKKDGQKTTHYQCIYCSKEQAQHSTRMEQHLLDCPVQVKQTFQHNQNKKRKFDVTSENDKKSDIVLSDEEGKN